MKASLVSNQMVPRMGGGMCALPRGLSPVLVVVLWCLFWNGSQAQPALQNAIVNDQGIAARQQERARSFAEVEGVEAGPVQFSLAASYALEFNDNVNYSENDPEGDFIQIPSVTLGVVVPISERSELTFEMGLGYKIYWHHENLSRWWLAPGSVLSYDLQVKDVFINLYDRFSYTDDVYSNPDIANQAEAPIFDNIIGTQISWVPDRFLVTAGYGYQITYSPDEADDYLNRRTHLPFARGGYIFADGAANSWLEFSATFTE